MKNKRKILYLFTNYFPFGNDTGEMYLRYEINYLCEIFDEINVISCNGNETDKILIENIPNNLKVITLSDSNNKLKYMLKTIKVFLRKKDGILQEEWNKTSNIKEKIFLSYFTAKCENRINKLDKKGVFAEITNDDFYLYSYRLFDLAYIAIKIKERYMLNSKVKIFSRAHGYDLYEYANIINYLPMREYLLSNLNHIYCCSKNGMNYLTEKYKQYSDKINFSYLGSEDFGFEISNNNYNNKLEIVSCSNLKPVKQINFIAEVISKLSCEIDVHWTHIGGNNSELHKYINKYKKLVNDNIIDFKGNMSHNEVIEFYKNRHFDLFINLSKSEGISQSIMEAISCGIPAIATNVGGTPEIVKNNISGFLVDKIDSEEIICNKIISYYNLNNQYKMKLRKSTRKYWEDNFNVEKNVKEFIKKII